MKHELGKPPHIVLYDEWHARTTYGKMRLMILAICVSPIILLGLAVTVVSEVMDRGASLVKADKTDIYKKQTDTISKKMEGPES